MSAQFNDMLSLFQSNKDWIAVHDALRGLVKDWPQTRGPAEPQACETECAQNKTKYYYNEESQILVKKTTCYDADSVEDHCDQTWMIESLNNNMKIHIRNTNGHSNYQFNSADMTADDRADFANKIADIKKLQLA